MANLPLQTYSLSDIYDYRYSYRDCEGSNYYYSIGLSDTYNSAQYLPTFARFLKSGGYDKTRKIFSSLGLIDKEKNVKIPLIRFSLNQAIRFIDFTISDPKSVANNFSLARSERSEANTSLGSMKIVFTANPWDIATMSMRGIRSCMTWSSHHSKTLAGSILDPYCGLIYLTEEDPLLVKHGYSSLGRKMVARAVVRYIWSPTKGFLVLLEKTYVTQNANSGTYHYSSILFKKYLQDNCDLKVIITDELEENMVIPRFGGIEHLSEGYLSYRDSGIKYGPTYKHA